MNVAYKHLDAKLRIAELTLGQWVGVVVGVGVALLWGLYLSPLGAYATLVSAIYLGALPAGAALLAGMTEFDPWLIARSAIRWRRGEGLYMPGPGQSARGYVVSVDPSDVEPLTMRSTAELDLASLWEES